MSEKLGGGVDVRVLGPLQAWDAGRELALGGTRTSAVLAMLALSVNEVVSMDALVDGLWGPAAPDKATSGIHVSVSRLRKSLQGDRPAKPAVAGVVKRRRPGYVLELDPDCVDLQRFERLGREGTAAFPAAPEVAVDRLTRALLLWRGPALAEFGALPFAQAEIPRLAEQRLNVIVARVQADLVLGRHANLVPELERLVAHHPLHERLHEQLMLSLYRSGRQADALEIFRRARRTFADELGIEPGRALQEMETAILSQDPHLDHAPMQPGLGVSRSANLLNLPRRNRHFIGRTAELLQIEQRLAAASAGRGPSALTLFGLVGAGKSALTLEYAHRHLDAYQCVWWINSDTRAALAAGLESLASRLGCEIPADREQGLDSLWSELERRGTWLLIFDNAATTEDLEVFWPRASNGTILISSLNPDWRRFAEVMEVKVMTSEESVELLASRHQPDDESPTADLAQALGYLPLALGQAAAYMDQTGMSAGQYLEMFLRRRGQLLQRGVPDDHLGTIEATWRLASAELSATDPAAVQLIALGSFLAAEHIPLDLVRRGREILPSELHAAVDDEIGLEDAIRHARRYSLLDRTGDEFAMHFLVQEVVSASLTAAEQDDWRRCLGLLLAQFAPPSVESRSDWPRWEVLGPHVLAFVKHCISAQAAVPEFVALLRRTSGYYLSRASYAEALTLQQAALTLIDGTADQADDLLVGQVLTELGTAFEQSGRYREALAAQERAVAILQRLRGPDDPSVARALSGLGSVITCHSGVSLWKADELDEAERRLADALQVLQTALGSTDPMVARTMAALGQVVQDRGDLITGQHYFEGAVHILETAYGPNHPETARTYSRLAFLLSLRGEHERSADLQEQAIATLEAAFGVDHIEVGWPLSNLAMVHLAAGRPDDALEAQRRAHAIFATADPEGAAAQISAWRVAKVQLAMGQRACALLTLESAMNKLRQVMDVDHPDVLAMEADLAAARASVDTR